MPDPARPPSSANDRDRKWLVLSLGAAVIAAITTGIALYLPQAIGVALILVAAAAGFVFTMRLHPDYWHRRMAALVLGVWAVASAAPTLEARLSFGDETLGQLALSGASWQFHLTTILLVVFLLWRDARKGQIGIRSAAQNLKRSLADESEVLPQLPKGSREKIALQQLQQGASFFGVDTSTLTRDQKHDLAVKQIDLKEGEMIRRARYSTGVFALGISGLVALVAVLGPNTVMAGPSRSAQVSAMFFGQEGWTEEDYTTVSSIQVWDLRDATLNAKSQVVSCTRIDQVVRNGKTSASYRIKFGTNGDKVHAACMSHPFRAKTRELTAEDLNFRSDLEHSYSLDLPPETIADDRITKVEVFYEYTNGFLRNPEFVGYQSIYDTKLVTVVVLLPDDRPCTGIDMLFKKRMADSIEPYTGPYQPIVAEDGSRIVWQLLDYERDWGYGIQFDW